MSERDPTFAARLARDDGYWSAALGLPPATPLRLRRFALRGALLAPASLAAVRHRAAKASCRTHAILVPGGLSSVRSAWSDLLACRPERQPWQGLPLLGQVATWRFEHDAFLPLMHNVRHLVEAIETAMPAGEEFSGAACRIALIAHSRGGIVAGIAAAVLRQRRPDLKLRLFAFGTPHRGTLVFRRISARWFWLGHALNALQGLLGDMTQPVTKIRLEILSRALRGDIPPGFCDVEPDRLTGLLAATPSFQDVTAWSSRWLHRGTARGHGRGIVGFLVSLVTGFELRDGDGLATWHCGTGPASINHDASPAFHTGYFRHKPAMLQLHGHLSHFFSTEQTFPPDP
jgi:hypothetical protein